MSLTLSDLKLLPSKTMFFFNILNGIFIKGYRMTFYLFATIISKILFLCVLF